ncbi:hypothetical protein [Actinoplanes sp. NPDC023714]|uniref:hypothetical protein n=1 Tax=Actinoplanes sp. NPDC023714 TaxID=3154322 RepID=UPI0033E3CC04
MAAVLVLFPGLPIAAGDDAGSYQATVDAAIAAITAAMLVVVPAVVAVTAQALSQFSWQTVSVLVGWRTAISLAAAALVGICLPLGLAVNPSPPGTRVAFSGFFVAIAIIGSAAAAAVLHATPEWLVGQVSRRALRRRRSSRYAAILGDLISNPRLPVGEHRLAVAAWVGAMLNQAAKSADASEIGQAVREIGAELGKEVGPTHRAAVAGLIVVGLRLRHESEVSEAVCDVLFEIAVRARAAGRHDIAREALDGLTETVAGRLEYLIAPKKLLHLFEPAATADDECFVDRPATADFARVAELASQPLTWESLERCFPDHDRPDHRYDDWSGYELLESTVDRLVSVMSPSGGAPATSHQEAAEFATDVRRLGALGTRLFRCFAYSRCDAVETDLETVAARLIGADVLPPRPIDRTGWRRGHFERRPHPASVLAEVMSDLAMAAFESGYDRRALLTGRRLISLATAAAQAGDKASVVAYVDAVYRFVNRKIYHSSSRVVAARGAVVVAGLIEESEELRRVLPWKPDERDSARDTLGVIAWQPSGHERELAAAAWLVEARAAHRMSPELRSAAVEELRPYSLGAGTLSATILLTLWADSVQAHRDGDEKPALELAAFLKSAGKQRGRLGDAAAAWASVPASKAVLRASRDGTLNLGRVINAERKRPGFADWTYHGVTDADDSSFVIVTYDNGEKLLLRDREAGARGVFTWGYEGNGPDALAEELAAHLVGRRHLLCADCFGAAAALSDLITCMACRSSGRRRGATAFTATLAERVVTRLPRSQERPVAPEVLWSRTRVEILQAVLDVQ